MKSKFAIKLISLCLFILLFSGTGFSSIVTKTNVDTNFIVLPQNFEKSDIVEIFSPRSSCPVIVGHGGNFTVRIESKIFENIYFYISTAYESIVDEFWLEVKDTQEIDGLWYVNVSVPLEVPSELYNLTAVVLKDDTYHYNCEPRAVNVVDEIDDNFTFIHITDLHVGDPRGFAESITETIGYKSIKKCISEINLLHPDFVVISGDLVFGQLYPFEYKREYKKCYEMLQMFDVPTYLAPGNHDGYRRLGEDGLSIWQEYFGPLYYSFDYGGSHFLSINSFDWPARQRWAFSFLALNWGGSIGDEQIDWVENDLESNDANLTLMLMHHNPIWDTIHDNFLRLHYKNQNKILNLIDDYNVDMVLAGHVHWDNVTIKNDTIFVTTTTPESGIEVDDGYWGYRMIKVEDGSIVSYNYKEPKYSIPSYKLDLEYESQYIAKVTNDLEKNMSVLVKFTVPKRAYLIENATVIQTRENGLERTYYLKTQVEKESEKEIKLSFIS